MSHKRERPSRQTEANTKPVEDGKTNSTAIDRQKRATARLRAAIRADLCDRLDQTSGRILGTQPVSYGMSPDELTTHAHELQRVHRWQPWEIRARLTNPTKQVAA